MTNNKTGFNYYNTDTDRYQDMRIKRLKKDFSCSGIAIYDYILCEIYRVKGCFIEWDENTAFDVSEYFGIKESLVGEVVNYCCSVGLFNKELLANERILTSSSIQKRFLDMCKRAKRSDLKVPERVKIPEESAKLPEKTKKLPEKKAKIPHRVEKSRVKKRKVEESSNTLTHTQAEIDYLKFQKWINENAIQVSKMKEPFTLHEFEKLKNDFDVGFIQHLLLVMHNYKPLLSKNINANLTFRNWAKREHNGKTIQFTSKVTDSDAIVDAVFAAHGR